MTPKQLLPTPKTFYRIALFDTEKQEWMVGDEILSSDQAKHLAKEYLKHGLSVTIIEELHRTTFQQFTPYEPPEGERLAA